MVLAGYLELSPGSREEELPQCPQVCSMDFGGDRDSGCKQPVWARWIGALGYMWDAWMCEVAPRQRRVRTTDVEVGIVGAGAAGMPAAERARGRAGVRCGWWACVDDVGP